MLAPSNPAQDLVDEEFPDVYRPLVAPALRRAYASADRAYELLDFLGNPSGPYQRGDLVMLAVEHQFKKLIEEKHLPFESTWPDYPVPTGKHLVMRSSRALITINQVEYPNRKPRWAKFRHEFATPNGEYLFPYMNAEYQENSSKKHILLLHGHGQLRFSNLAIPNPTENYLIWQSEDLLKLAPAENSDGTGSGGEGPTESPDAELVEEIIKTVRDRG